VCYYCAVAERGKVHVLVVDDEESIRTLLADALTEEGYEPRTAASAHEALAAVDRRVPDVIVLDMRMPDDGPRFKADLRRRSLHAPIVATSASREGAQWAAALGAPFIAKPFVLDDFFSKLRFALAEEEPDRSSEGEFL
jgi:DNA-binding NtrC family response regulator